MARSIQVFKNVEPIGTFIALSSQPSRRAPLKDAEIVQKDGVYPGMGYLVYAAIEWLGFVWLMLEPVNPNTPEWVRERVISPGGDQVLGSYSGSVTKLP